MTITCRDCGRAHALYWYVDKKGGRKVCYTCNHHQRQGAHRLTDAPEMHIVTVRAVLEPYELSKLTETQLAKLPVVESTVYLKAQSEEAQCKLPL